MATRTKTPEQTRADFRSAVNMSASEIDDWLATQESQRVGKRPSPGSEDRKSVV